MRNVLNLFKTTLRSSILLFFCLLVHTVSGQISYGGKPLPLNAGMAARSTEPNAGLFVDMPSFDAKGALLRSQQEQTKLKSLEFAHKFYPFLRPENSGIAFVSGNMKVWRVGIRSKGAYSLNILFSKFRLPPGAQVFVYNADQSEILGSYTEKNNSELNMLPVQPVAGEELIVEYQEPLDAEFEGEIEVGEVNHDFLGLLKATEPRDPGQSCHPNLVCYPEDIQPGSGVVVLIINGTTYCTGSLVNNTAEDATPYILTATHCINNNFYFNRGNNPTAWQKYGTSANWLYDAVAGSIVFFFNYNSPLCSTNIRGPVQMTMASADSVLISEMHDISLLKLKEIPPVEYQPFYLGWNAEDARSAYPFHGLHHPNGGVKKVAIEDDRLSLGSFNLPNSYPSASNSFWEVGAWDVAATEGGSSGSPLLDRNKRIIGTLTGGLSYCGTTGADSYASLYRFWDEQGSINNPDKISDYLNPRGPGEPETKQLGGFNPYADHPYTRSNNFKSGESAIQSKYQTVPLFATNNTFGYTEFAEEFYARENVSLQGVFVSSAPINPVSNISNMNIRIRVYSGEDVPEQLLHEQPFTYNFAYYNSDSDFREENRNMGYNVENYIRFNNPIEVSGSFYISYYDRSGVTTGFSVHNVEPRMTGSGIASTAWMKNATGWVKSSENLDSPANTALLITPYVIGTSSMSVELEKEKPWVRVLHSNADKRIIIESNYELVEWEIYYSSGLKIYHEVAEIGINRATYSSSHLPKGVYIVRVRTEDGSVTAKKVIVL